ncbi:translation initiation factor IF-2-like [Antechinus flavipes]|uniref:translation initiation factor IF-2-like n=1 Tax=Antechinus flavipes TaxID=38775 RepID=UPI0022365319|nr:translation initiation factor IF-2-like [Antechinus flavipes]
MLGARRVALGEPRGTCRAWSLGDSSGAPGGWSRSGSPFSHSPTVGLSAGPLPQRPQALLPQGTALLTRGVPPGTAPALGTRLGIPALSGSACGDPSSCQRLSRVPGLESPRKALALPALSPFLAGRLAPRRPLGRPGGWRVCGAPRGALPLAGLPRCGPRGARQNGLRSLFALPLPRSSALGGETGAFSEPQRRSREREGGEGPITAEQEGGEGKGVQPSFPREDGGPRGAQFQGCPWEQARELPEEPWPLSLLPQLLSPSLGPSASPPAPQPLPRPLSLSPSSSAPPPTPQLPPRPQHTQLLPCQ